MSDKAVLLQGDCLEVLKELPSDSLDSLVTDPPAGISFMGKAWDEDKGGRKQWIAWMSEVMTECLRVLKPGAHGLVWAIPRTSHWTATALEDAGFEIRDVVTHLFGSGFPKSLDISKAIDKAAGAEREVLPDPQAARRNKSPRAMAPGEAHRQAMAPGEALRKAMASVTAPSTDEAKQWQGWGTALKPASEHWILVRKPISEKTVATNTLKHGTGGINIDVSRVSSVVDTSRITTNIKGGNYIGGNGKGPLGGGHSQGRFPANLVLSHNADCVDSCTPGCAVAELDKQSGVLKQGGAQKGSKIKTDKANWGKGSIDAFSSTIGEPPGGASRFFYCAKASKKDKGTDNTHPTVKSSTLMSYLIKLITPPEGVVLDPFMGSGSTGVSAVKEGFAFIGIEKEDEYFKIAEARINDQVTRIEDKDAA